MSPHSWATLFVRDSVRFLIYILYCVEGGLFLMVVPWIGLWERNWFFDAFPLIAAVGLHPVSRGLVSGLGLALLLHGIAELARLTRTPRDSGERP